jgi:hypothetical protein
MILEKTPLLQRILGTNPSPRVITTIAVLLVLPSLAGGLAFDDYVHRLTVYGNPVFASVSSIDVFRFADGDPVHGQTLIERGILPWFSRPDARLAFFRPLASLSHWIDYKGLDLPPWAMHAENIAWYGLLVFATLLLFRRTLVAGAVAGLLYAVDLGHGLPAAWLANRNALMAGAFGVLTLVAYDRARRDGWRFGKIIGPACFALALASGEAGIGALAFVVAHTLSLDSAPVRRRLAAVLPYAAIAGAWQILYRALGYGVSGSGFYVDPAHSPGAYLEALVTRAPILVAGEITLVPVEPSAALSRAQIWAVAMLAALVCALFAWAILPIVRRDPAARFMAIGALLALPATCMTYPSSRLLVFSGIGICGLLALLFADVAARVERRTAARGASHFARAAHLFVAPCLLPLAVLVPRVLQRAVDACAPDLPDANAFVGRTLVVARSPNFLVSGFRFGVPSGKSGALPGPLRILGTTLAPTELRRVDAYTLEIRAADGLTGDVITRLYRDTPMHAGETVTLSDMRATVLEVGADGAPRAVAFRFATPLEDPSRTWIAWEGWRFVPFTPPPAGSAVALR